MYFAIKGQEKMFGHLYETEEEAGQSLDRLQHRMTRLCLPERKSSRSKTPPVSWRFGR